jgi:phosphatidylserine/phosphatidylglycerophosphate/cardiolipin synthase-like enzyme
MDSLNGDIFFGLFLGGIVKRIISAIFATVYLFTATPALFSEPIANYEILFSPDDHIAEKLITLIEAEKESIRAAVYCLRHHGIAKALIEAHERGVDVEVIIDPYSVKARSAVKKMGTANLRMFVWDPTLPTKVSKGGKKTKQRKPLMHDKFCVLGNNRVWTGSFNFTFEATHSNRENVIVLESPQVAARYLKEFEKLKQAGCISLNKYIAMHDEQ